MVLSARQFEERKAGAPPAPVSGSPAPAAAVKEEAKAKPFSAAFVHPDSTEQSPVNCRIRVSASGRDFDLYVDRGRVETDDPGAARALEAAGYRRVDETQAVEEDPAWTAAKARLRSR